MGITFRLPKGYAAGAVGAMNGALDSTVPPGDGAAMAADKHSDRAGARFDAALALHRAGQWREALRGYDQVLKFDPRRADAHCNRGIVLALLGKPDAAIAAFARALGLAPGHAEAAYNLGVVHAEAGAVDPAATAFRRALAADPAHLQAATALAMLLARAERGAEAVAAFDAALALDPAAAPLHYARAVALTRIGEHERAVAGFEAVLAPHPGHVESLWRLGLALAELRRFDAAIARYDAALALAPGRSDIAARRLHASQQGCAWDRIPDDLAEVAAAVRGGLGIDTPFMLLALTDDPDLHRAAAANYLADPRRFAAPAPPLPAHRPGDRLRIGYFSADFCTHATMVLIAELLEAHDRRRFDVTLFGWGGDDDDGRARARAAADHFVDITRLDDTAAAALARERRIDLAVDLKGLTTAARPGIFLARAAPVQVSFLGYPGTLGSAGFDYIVADAVVVPDALRPHYAEALVRLPGSYQPNGRWVPPAALDPAARAAARTAAGLPGGFVFACFNQASKIDAATFALWMDILAAVPTSALWLWVDDPAVRARLHAAAGSHGVDPARLVFAAALPRAEHLDRLRLADLFVDCFPYGAHTTGSDALRMALPIVTRAGTSFASRVAASLLAAVGLPELAVADADAYRALAIALATDPDRLAAVRAGLAAALPTAPLFDPVGYARALEAAFGTMADRSRGGLPPADFDIDQGWTQPGLYPSPPGST